MNRLLYTFFAVIGWMEICAQTIPSKRYTTADGLVSDRITCMAQDQQGFLWTGSYFGLSRYDGYQFVNLKLPEVQQNKFVSAITATDSAVYAGFIFGGGLMEYRQGKATAFKVPAFKGKDFNDVLALCPHTTKGVLVCGSGNSVYHFAEGRFRFLFALDSTYLHTDFYRCLAMDSSGNIWIATDKGMAVYTVAGKLTPVSYSPTFSLQSFGKGVIAVSIIDGNAVMTLAGEENGVLKIKKLGEAAAVVPVMQDNFQPGHAWLFDTSGRLINLTHEGKATSFLAKEVAGNDVYFLYSDRENNLWVATQTGLVKMPNLHSRFHAFRELASGTGQITGNDSNLWIANGKFLYRIRDEEKDKLERVDTKFSGALFSTHDEVWFGNLEDGLGQLRFNKNKILSARYFTNFGKTKIRVHTITNDANGGVWVGGESGIFYIRDGNITAHFQPMLKNGQPAFIVAMVVDIKNHIIWLGDNSRGIMKIHFEFSGSNIRYRTQHYIDTSGGLTDGHIRSMLLDSKGAIWVGTRFSGVFRIVENNNQVQVQNLSAQAGMRCTRVTDIKEVGKRAIWIATCNGIYRYSHGSGKWKAYTTADGLQEAEVFASFISTDEKQGWVTSASGVTSLDLYRKDLPLPLINLTRVTVLGKEDSSAVFQQQSTVYRPNESSIGFQFAGASYTDEKKIWYKYQLEGYDHNWSTPTQSNVVNYASLPPGNYTFKVLASVDNNQWSAVPASFSFTIQKPFYKSPLFFILVLGGLMAGIYFLHAYRLQQKLKVERLRSRISADLHDDIGSTLSSISIISEGALQEKDLAASRLMMKEISENTQLLMDKMDDIIWCVNPQNDSFRNLMLRIKKFSALLFEAKGIDYNISIDPRINDITLPMNQRQHLYLILKEAVNNLAKYSGATQATIDIHCEGSYLHVKVADNGRGFDVGKQRNGNGLRNMKRRADMLPADLKIDSNRSGTTVFLRTKIK